MENEEQDALIGQTIGGRYLITRLLGEGGMGKVYLAEQLIGKTIRKVAIKTLHTEFIRNKKIVARFKREYEVMSLLEHENIVRFYDYGELENKAPYMVMEYVDGEILGKGEKKKRWEIEEIEKVMVQVGRALMEAHKKGIVHRDLKPENIIVMKKGTGISEEYEVIKLVDFGIAKQEKEKEEDTRLTAEGSFVGTMAYMSPEQLLRGEADRRSDIYSMGVMVYELVTGECPIQGETLPDWAMKHVQEEPTLIECYGRGAALPKHKRDAIMKALSKKPEDRQQTALEFIRELTGYEEPQRILYGKAESYRQSRPKRPIEDIGMMETMQALPARKPGLTPGPNEARASEANQVIAEGQLEGPSLIEREEQTTEPEIVLSRRARLISWAALIGLVMVGLWWAFSTVRNGGTRTRSSEMTVMMDAEADTMNGQGYESIGIRQMYEMSPEEMPPTENGPDASALQVNQADSQPSDASATQVNQADSQTNESNRLDASTEQNALSPAEQAQLSALAQTLSAQLASRDLDGAIDTYLSAQRIVPTRNHSALATMRGQIASYGSRYISLILQSSDCNHARLIYFKLQQIGAHSRSTHLFTSDNGCSL